MSKLFKLKQWLTVPEAAKHLSVFFEEEATEADIYRYALNGDLKLSVNLINHAKARPGQILPIAEAATRPLYVYEDGSPAYLTKLINGRVYALDLLSKEDEDITEKVTLQKVLAGLPFDKHSMINIDHDKYITISGIFDLPMVGGEAIDIENLCMQSLSGPEVELIDIEGSFVTGKGNSIYQLQEIFPDYLKEIENRKGSKPECHEKYYPAGGLPEDSLLVVRTENLSKFIQSLLEEDKLEKPLSTKERNSLHAIILALAELAKIDTAKGSAAPDTIKSQAELLGLSISPGTIRSHIKAARELLHPPE